MNVATCWTVPCLYRLSHVYCCVFWAAFCDVAQVFSSVVSVLLHLLLGMVIFQEN